MSRLGCLVASVLLLLVGFRCTEEPLPVQETEPLPSDSTVDRFVQETRAKHNLPALAAIVVRADSVVAVSASGLRRNGARARVTPRDRFHLGSNTKAMTATLAAILVEDGALSWDTTPLDVFPALADSIHANYRDVTLEQLLAHRAGLPSFTSSEEFAVIQRFSGPPTDRRRAFMSAVLQQEPEIEPGSGFLYSNAGYTIAAAMTETVADATWEDLMRNRLFGPMNITGGFGFLGAVDPTQPSGHFARGDTLIPSRRRSTYEPAVIIGPAGDVNMSLPDYARFLQLHLRGLRGEPTALLSPSAIQNLHASRGGMSREAEMPGYGLGWVMHDALGVRSSSHAGSIGRFKARATIQASRDLAVAVVANAGGDAADSATRELRKTLLTRYGAGE